MEALFKVCIFQNSVYFWSPILIGIRVSLRLAIVRLETITIHTTLTACGLQLFLFLLLLLQPQPLLLPLHYFFEWDLLAAATFSTKHEC